MTASAGALKKTPLYDLHRELGGKMVAFAGYEMPVQYPMGVLQEHRWTREKAGLFDVSHMGQAFLKTSEAELGTEAAHAAIAAALETLVPGEVARLKRGRMRYSVLLDEDGGVRDDLMITRPGMDEYQGWLFLVVNAAVKAQDYQYIRSRLGGRANLDVKEDLALLALQGPCAAAALAQHAPEIADMPFMSSRGVALDGARALVSRAGYTGEDGFEISLRAQDAAAVARMLLADERVAPIGLGARDSLRLEAGLCLYGHDMTRETNPVEANIAFAIGKRRRAEGGFPGAEKILADLKQGPKRLRVGILPEGRAPAREGAEILSEQGKKIGQITSGGFAPSLGRPIAMGYVERDFAASDTPVAVVVRGKALPARVANMPFAPHRYFRG